VEVIFGEQGLAQLHLFMPGLQCYTPGDQLKTTTSLYIRISLPAVSCVRFWSFNVIMADQKLHVIIVGAGMTSPRTLPSFLLTITRPRWSVCCSWTRKSKFGALSQSWSHPKLVNLSYIFRVFNHLSILLIQI
jgi:hypothetical protein